MKKKKIKKENYKKSKRNEIGKELGKARGGASNEMSPYELCD